MKNFSKRGIGAAAVAVALTAGVGAAAAAQLTVVNAGGANGDAQKEAFIRPFEAQTGAKVTMVAYNGEQAKVQAMVDAKHVDWDVVEVASGDIGRTCDAGLYQKLDWSRIGAKQDFIPAAVHPCGVGIFVWATVLAYNADKLKGTPKSWADFWDVKKFPGKRAMRKGPEANLEFALMADGVAPRDVYKVLATHAGQDRDFRKLDGVKPYIQWWEAGAQPPQILVAGDVVMSTAYNGRIDQAQKEGRNLQIVWNGAVDDIDYWAIPTGTPNKELATKFIAFASSANSQKRYAQDISYGPVNITAIRGLDSKRLLNLPSGPDNSKSALVNDFQFWADHAEELEQRFAAWASR